MSKAFEAHDLHLNLKGHAALVGLKAEAERAERTAIFGPAGSGKSALLACLAGVHVPTKGGFAVAGGSPERAETREVLAYLPQGVALHYDLSVEDNLRTFASALGLRDAESAVNLALEKAWLTGKRGERVRYLSQGLKQRASLAVALLGKPEVLLLDEPFAGAEAPFVEACFAHLGERAAAGAGVLIATSDAQLAARCERVLVLRGGRLVGDLRPAEALKPQAEATFAFREKTGLRQERHAFRDLAVELPPLIVAQKPTEVHLKLESLGEALLRHLQEGQR